jgi:hypothetical protein
MSPLQNFNDQVDAQLQRYRGLLVGVSNTSVEVGDGIKIDKLKADLNEAIVIVKNAQSIIKSLNLDTRLPTVNETALVKSQKQISTAVTAITKKIDSISSIEEMNIPGLDLKELTASLAIMKQQLDDG